MTTTAAASVSERLDAIARRYPSTGIRALLSLRGRDPFARQELAQLISRDTTLTERLHTSYRESRVNRPSNQPFTARDILDHWGYRVVHTSTVGNAISDIIGPAYFRREDAGFWEWNFVVSTYAVVLTEKLGVFDDEAFAGAFLANTALLQVRRDLPDVARAAQEHAERHRLLIWESERELFGASHLDLARRLAEEWHAPASLLDAFDHDLAPGSLAQLLFRSQAAAARHGIVDPSGPPIPEERIAEHEPILDAYLAKLGSPQSVRDTVRSLMATARVPLD